MNSDLLTEEVDLPLQMDESTQKGLQRFAKEAIQQNASYVACTLPIDLIDPLSCLQTGWQAQTFNYYWEKPSEHFAIAAGGELLSLSAEGSGRFGSINRQYKKISNDTAVFKGAPHAYAGLMFLGGFSFFDRMNDSRWNSFEPASLTIPKWLVFRDDKYAFVTTFTDVNRFNESTTLFDHLISSFHRVEQIIETARSVSFRDTTFKAGNGTLRSHNSLPAYQSWIPSVKQAKQFIRTNEFDKIVLARRFSVPKKNDQQAVDMLHNLRMHYPGCSCFLVHQPKGNSFLGTTPEYLGSFHNNLLLTEALAGSMERGGTQEEDTMLENKLRFSPKNKEEHQFVVRDIRQRLQSLTESIYYDHQPRIKKLSNVQHLNTPIRAHLKDDTDILSVVEQLHPTPAVGGYPRKEAMNYIRGLEDFERGWYAGPVGWMTPSGSGEFAVAIRSGLLSKDKAHFFAGCGIVADSDPKEEWEETNLKLSPMLSALNYD
ncbi:MAG TPA: isochorismate synthase [Fodinibius sp.]|nr:isochorismate synthase [Fodinibius sp.]